MQKKLLSLFQHSPPNCICMFFFVTRSRPTKILKKNAVRIQISTMLSNAQKTAGIEKQVSNQVQQLQTVRSASSGPKQQFKEVTWFPSTICDSPFCCKEGRSFSAPGTNSTCPREQSLIPVPPLPALPLLSAIPQRVKGWDRKRLCFTLEGKTSAESEILAHLTIISAHGPGSFHGSWQKSTFPFCMEAEICCSPPAQREVWSNALSVPMHWMCAYVRVLRLSAELMVWFLNSE